MDLKDIFAEQSEIKITVMKIGTQKLTKSLLEQLPAAWPFDGEMNFTADKCFGFVKVKVGDVYDEILVFQKGNKIFRCNLRSLYGFVKISENSYLVSLKNTNRSVFYRIFNDETETHDENGDPLKIQEYAEYKREVLKQIQENAIAFIEEIKEHQIFI